MDVFPNLYTYFRALENMLNVKNCKSMNVSQHSAEGCLSIRSASQTSLQFPIYKYFPFNILRDLYLKVYIFIFDDWFATFDSFCKFEFAEDFKFHPNLWMCIKVMQ